MLSEKKIVCDGLWLNLHLDKGHYISGLNDMLGYHGASVDELNISFKNCIDNYLIWCKEAGKQPEKEFKSMFNVRISPESHRKAALEAAIDGITMNQFVSEAIDEKIARRGQVAN